MKRFFTLAILSGALAVAAPASAHGFFSLHVGIPGISVNLGLPPVCVPPVCVRPAPVYVAPTVYVRPAVVLAPPAVVVRPAPVVVVPRRIVVPPVVVVHPRPHRIVVAAPRPY